MVKKQGSPWAKDSIDFIMTILHRGLDNNKAWGVEIKSRVSARSSAAEEEFMSDACCQKPEYIQSDNEHKMIKCAKECIQLLHHSFVYDFDKVLLIVGNSQSEIIQSTVIFFIKKLKSVIQKS